MFTKDSQEKIPLKGIVDARTVVEKQDYVATGVLTYAEGDLLEIELTEYELYDLNDAVKITIYSPVGIHMIDTKIIAKYSGAIIVLHPPHEQARFEDKRRFPRILSDKTGSIQAIKDAVKLQSFQPHIIFRLKDISMEGIGFTIAEAHQEFKLHTHLVAELDLNMNWSCGLRIVRTSRDEAGRFYGAELVHPSEEAKRQLRAYILKQQIENHYESINKARMSTIKR